MILGSIKLAHEIAQGNNGDKDGIAVIPGPNTDLLASTGEASVSLRLGRWFLNLRQSSETHLKTISEDQMNENKYAKSYFVPFGEPFILHPNRFVLACTLEWIRLPIKYAAFVVGKSTLGRRGIIIETASGIHPDFSGCLTLEIANVGEIPVELISGMQICQLFFHEIKGDLPSKSTRSSLAGQRKPRLGRVSEDKILTQLQKTKR